MSVDDYHEYGSNKSKDEQRRHTDLTSDTDFNSTYGSDIDEDSLPAYQSPEAEVLQPTTVLIAWTSVPRSPFSSTDNSDDCVVCGIRPKHPPYPTCGLACAAKLKASRGSYPTRGLGSTGSPNYLGSSNNSGGSRYSGSSGSSSPMCIVCGVRPSYSNGNRKYPTCGLTCKKKYEASKGSSSTGGPSPSGISGLFENLSLGCNSGSTGSSTSAAGSVSTRKPGMCVVCGIKPSYSKGGKRYITCSLSCRDTLRASGGLQHPSVSGHKSSSGAMCVVCGVHPCHSNEKRSFPTCGMTCAEKLANGGGPQNMCEYCHRKPRFQNYLHCGTTCRDKAKVACLICRCHAKNGKYHLCGKTCRDIAMKTSPLLVEVRPDHVTFEMVETKFQNAWSASEACPKVKKVYKVMESKAFLQPYDVYRKKHGNEVFRYHGTSRQCSLGSNGHSKLCNSSSCAACSILRTSFDVSLGNPAGAFGQGIYTSSASNKSAGYSGMPNSPERIMFLNKVILGKPYNVSTFARVTSCPIGHDSVVFDRQGGALNETIVYRNDAIRPVFLIVFG